MKSKTNNASSVAVASTLSTKSSQVKSATSISNSNSGSVVKHGNTTASAVAHTASAKEDREKIQVQLDKQLQQRPSAIDLKNRNILRDTNASPALQSAQQELQRLQLESQLDAKLSSRPPMASLVKQNILPAEASDGIIKNTVLKQSKTANASTASVGKRAITVQENKQTALKESSSTVQTSAIGKKTGANKQSTVSQGKKNMQLVAHDPQDYQLVAHDPHDYQLVAHDPKNYQLVAHDPKDYQLMVSPRQQSSSWTSSRGNDVMLDEQTGSPLSRKNRRKQKKLLKLRDSLLQQQVEQIPPHVSNLSMMHDPMQSHKSNALVPVQSTNKAAQESSKKIIASSSTIDNAKGKQLKQQSSKSQVESNDAREGRSMAKQASSKSVSRSTSPANKSNVAVVSTPSNASKTQVNNNATTKATLSTASASRVSTKNVQTPPGQPLKQAPSPIISAKTSSASIRVRS